MATEKQIKDFINRIGPCAVNAYKALGKILPSVCIGMACVESAYGTAGSAKHNSFLGQKVGTGKTATKYWNGTFFKSRTSEEYTIGVHTVITDAFRSYDSMQQCVLNYYELLNTKLYSRVTAGVDYKTQMQQIKACGYMTSSTEVNTVIKLIQKYRLYEWDNEVLSSIGSSTDPSIGSSTDDKPATGNPYPEPTKNVKLNSKGNEVRWLQVELNRYGYRLVVDGKAGNFTIAALLDFQKRHSLIADGICGPLTREKLKGG